MDVNMSLEQETLNIMVIKINGFTVVGRSSQILPKFLSELQYTTFRFESVCFLWPCIYTH